MGDHVRVLRFTRADVILVAPHDRISRLMPERGTAVGAGPVRSFTAWFLQQYGLRVTMCDREEIAAGWSRGNAGWLNPPTPRFCLSLRCRGTGACNAELRLEAVGGAISPQPGDRRTPASSDSRTRELDTMRSSVDRAPPAAR